MQAIFKDIHSEANRRAKNRSSMVADEVEWDLNMRSSEARLAPFVYRSAAGATFEITQRKGPANEPGAPHSGTGTALWTAAVGLAKYLEARYSLNESIVTQTVEKSGEGGDGGSNSKPGARTAGGLVGHRCLELGCGTGLVSLVAASLGASVVATDIPDIVEGHAQPNIDANLASLAKSGGDALLGAIEARSLVWGETNVHQDFGEDWDLIVASDVIYRATHVPLLLQTLQELMGGSIRQKDACQNEAHRKGPTALVAFDKRGREGIDAFLKAVAAPGSCFAVRHVTADEMPPGARFTHFGCVELTCAAPEASPASSLSPVARDVDFKKSNIPSVATEKKAMLEITPVPPPNDAAIPVLKTSPPLIVALAGAAAVAAAAIDLVSITAAACPEVNNGVDPAMPEQQSAQLTTMLPMDCIDGKCA